MITDTAPYGPTPSVILVLEKYRETGLGGGPFTVELLTRLGMGAEVARRVILSLKLLDLVDDDGVPTDNLREFKKASSEQYRAVLANQLRDSYAAVFAITGQDLDGKTPAQIEDAFRHFRPDSLRKRMVTLFLGLCEYAGIVTTPPKAKSGPKSGSRKSDGPAKVRTTVRPRHEPPPPPATRGDSYSVELASGGTVTLAVDVRLFDLTTTDRKFVIDLIDALKGYGTRPALSSGGETS